MVSLLRGQRLSIVLILLQQLLFAIDTTAIHRLGGIVSLIQIGFLRSVGGVLLAACLAPTIGWGVFYTKHPWLQMLRSSCTVGYTWVLIIAFSSMPLSDATAIGYVSGLYVVLLAGPLLGEVVGYNRYVAVIAGILGALLISKPGMSSISWIYLFVLAGNLLNSLAVILTKYLRRDDNSITIMLYVSLAQLVVFLPGAVESWNFSLSVVPWVLALIVTGPLGMLCGIVALNHADASVLAPYGYVRLIIAMVVAIVLFGEMPGWTSVLGSIVIVFACYFSAGGRGPRVAPTRSTVPISRW